MDYQAECFSTLARLLETPDAAFDADLALATDPALMPPQVAGQVALFAERLGALSLEERQELFAETFTNPLAASDRRSAVAVLRDDVTRASADRHAPALDRLTGALLSDRNPYHHVLVAVKMLLACAGV